jgi:hypothetical protein
MAARTRAREAAAGGLMTVPVRLDTVVLRGPLRGLDAGERTGYLGGVWILLAVVVGTVLVLLALAVPLLWVRLRGGLLPSFAAP